ncbi:MAG: Uma2 family endonuclease [Bacteroidales bacterium]|nr:Uma2 family endonuclease [Bacteroidales bacterium]
MKELTLDLNKRYSFADYLTWLDDKRRELFDGFIKIMTPAPSSFHQEVSIEIASEFRNFLKKRKCKVFHAPFDVRLPNDGKTSDNEIYTVVQPDISIICDLSKIDKRGCMGAPDLIVEIVSLNSKRDIEDKFQLYEKHGVKEYWIVYPHEKAISVFVLENKKFRLEGMFAESGKVKVNIFEDLFIDIEEIFSCADDYKDF